MLSFYKKYYKTAIDIGLIVLTVYFIMLAFSFFYKIATPIILAFFIYFFVEPLARFFHRRKLKKAAASAFAILIFVIVILGSATGLGIIFTVQIGHLLDRIPAYSQLFQEQVVERTAYLQNLLNNLYLSPEMTEKLQEYTALITQKATQILKAFLLALFAALTSVSTFVINFAIAIILAYFLSVESEQWKRFAEEKTPKTFKNAFYFLKENVLAGIVGYIKAQLILISITFTIIFITLAILGIHNAFSIALLSALFDILPLLGVPVIFVPWTIYLFIVGNTSLAISLAILLLIVMLFRQFLEPKITGNTLGVSAFTMLSFMIISLSLFGVAGLILSPILIILIKSLYEQGYLKRWIRLPQEEYDPV